MSFFPLLGLRTAGVEAFGDGLRLFARGEVFLTLLPAKAFGPPKLLTLSFFCV
jgi:hypothetical protein